MKRGLRALVLAIAAALACATLPVSAAADKPTESYLALGDSYAFAYNPLLDPRNAANFKGYPDSIASALGLSLTNAACPGETSGSMISGMLPDNGCHEHYPPLPLHVSYTGSQLAYAVNFLQTHRHTDLVTVQIGGNDVLMQLALCGGNFQCVLAKSNQWAPSVAHNLAIILAALRDQGHYRHTLVVVPYFSFNYHDPYLTGATLVLDSVLASTAARYHARVADAFGAFYAASANSLFLSHVPCFAGLQVITNAGPPPTCDIHPSALGHSVFAEAILDVVPGGEAEAKD